MKIIEITDDKLGKMSECIEKVLHYGGKLMSCIKELEGGGERFGERNSYRYGQRDEIDYRDEYDADDMPMYNRYGQRGRRRDSYGRFM